MAKSLQDLVAEAKAKGGTVSVAEAERRGADRTALVIDVREPAEYDAGHLPGALNVPRGMLELKVDPTSPVFDPQLGDRSRSIVTYCTGGINARSALATQTLKQMGFSNVVWLDGGLNAWAGAGKPVER